MATRKTPKGQKQTFLSKPEKTAVSRPKKGRRDGASSPSDNWLYGDHASFAALANPNRKCKRVILTKSKLENLSPEQRSLVAASPSLETMAPADLAALLPDHAIHQGIALLPHSLPGVIIEDLIQMANKVEKFTVAVLDQVTDPHNVGAILRSAAAFSVSAVIIPDRNSPPVTGVLARSASGALETVPLVRVSNLSRALDSLADNGFWRIGMDGKADKMLEEATENIGKVAIVLGSEGKGLRRLTEEKCDLLAKLPISPDIESLNVSNAAAIAFYELARKRQISKA